jgi:hypothetical protein
VDIQEVKKVKMVGSGQSRDLGSEVGKVVGSGLLECTTKERS